MKTLKFARLLLVVALFALPAAAISAQSGTNGYGNAPDSYTADDQAILAMTPAVIAASPSDAYAADDQALLAMEPWGNVATVEQAPAALPVTGGTPGLSALPQTEPGDSYFYAPSSP